MSSNLINKKSTNMRKYHKIITLTLSVSILAGFLSGCAGGDLSGAEYVERAKVYRDQGELQAATIELKNALGQNAGNVDARLLLASVYLDLGDGVSAEKELIRANELGIAKDAIILQLGEAYLAQAKFDQIIEEIVAQGSLAKSDEAQLHTLRGTAYLASGLQQEANEEFRAALELEPNRASVQVAQAQLAFVKGDLKGAQEWIDKALASDPESADAWSLRGDVEQTKGNFVEAEADFSKAIKARGYPTMELAKRAHTNIILQEYSTASKDLETLRNAGFKDHATVNYLQGLIFFNQKNYSDAIDALQMSYNAAQSFLPTLYYLASSHYMAGNLEQALEFAKSLEGMAPQSSLTKKLLGAIQINRSEFDTAIKVLSDAQSKSPNDIVLLRMLASASRLAGDTAQAVEFHEKIVALEPESTAAKTQLMLAKLMDRQSLDTGIAKADLQVGDIYTQKLLLAIEAFRQGKLDSALEQAKTLHQQYPDRADPLKLIASVYLVSAQWSKARTELENALAIKPNDTSATLSLAKVEINEGNIERAQSLLQELLLWDPQNENAILLLVYIEDSLGNIEASIQLLEQALKDRPDNLTIRESLARHYLGAARIPRVLEVTAELTDQQVREKPALVELRGKAQARSGDITAARNSFKEWTKLEPESARAHFLYGDTLARSGDAEKAQEELRRAIELDPGYVAARVGEIKMLVHSGEVEEARAALASLTKDFGDQPEVLGIRGWFAHGTGDYATAVETLTAVAQSDPSSQVTLLLAESLWAQQQQDKAIAVMQDWLQTDPRDLAVLLQLADGYLVLKRESEAIKAYSRIVELYPNQVPALNNLAWLSRNKEPKQAMDYATKAYSLAPESPEVLDTYGMLLLETGETTKAFRMIQRAAEIQPGDARIQLHRGVALVKLKKFDEAREVLTTLISEAPDSELADEAKALLASIP